ncbi:MAG: hypothetical protein KTV45_14655 [Acidimicrobiia bacterium]|nr:hypothetical protein [Acidimicrobiia bacterium]
MDIPRQPVGELARIHLTVDIPTRVMQTSEPDWVGRLRRVLFHVRAVNYWEVTIDAAHVIAPEIRVAYEQLDAMWEHLPKEQCPTQIDFDWWGKEASDDVLAAYTHPTPARLALPTESGGLSEGRTDLVFLQLIEWETKRTPRRPSHRC